MYENNRIKVTNTAIIVDNYDLHSCEELERPFTSYDPIRHKSEMKLLHYDEENKRLYIPGGYDIWRVRKALDEKYYTRIAPTPYKFMEGNIMINAKPRDEYQVEALNFMCSLNGYEDNASLSQLTLALNTGKGKSYCSIFTMGYYRIRSMVITNSNSLLSQWESEITKYTNIPQNKIVRISGSDYCNMILNGTSGKANNGFIYLCSHGTLRSFGERYGWDKVTQLFEYLGIGIKFFDECHLAFENMFLIDYYTNVYKTFYVSATPGRSDWKENRMFQISLKNVPMIDLFDENNDPHTSYVAIKWNSNPSPQQLHACRHPVYKFDRNKYVDYVTKKPEFYDMLRIIMDLVKRAVSDGGRVLIYIGTNEGVLRVYKWIADNYREYICDIGIFTSLVSKEEKLKEKQKKILLSTTKSAGVGEHINNLKMTVVLAEPFKSEVLARQTLGRTRDDNTMYIHCVDMAFVYIKKFYYNTRHIFEKYALDTSESPIDSYELRRRAQILEEERDIGWRYHPISLYDNRFDFDKLGIDPKETPGPKCPIKIFPKKKGDIFHK